MNYAGANRESIIKKNNRKIFQIIYTHNKNPILYNLYIHISLGKMQVRKLWNEKKNWRLLGEAEL